MYRYGGVYFDYDTVMLQDFRPLMEFKHFVYRRAVALA
jgi:mannosyltransferase OCH1-like enzyme